MTLRRARGSVLSRIQNNSTMIKTNKLSYSYNALQQTLRDITITLPEGHIYGLLGKNGVGKSTMLKMLTGSLIGQGEYTIDGLDPRQRQPELQQRFRLIPENEAIYNITITQLAEVTKVFYPTFDEKIFTNALKEFEVPTEQTLTRMSLGQQKKALISLSLACGTPYLFMDEPTNGMDIPSKSIFRRLVASIMEDSRTILISTHQIDDLESLIDSVIILENDGVLLSASLEEIGKRLCFGIAEEGDDVIYSEPTLHGVMSVMLNHTGEEMPVDVKLLFNAVIKNPQRIKEIFSNTNC